ncbi:hypothetical protein [Streptomyces zagrosensis]|uniref:hypothetical protein n=1 Tax=Streptomyces zagrosensis TaxID=1042984 RepID=UPI0035E42565
MAAHGGAADQGGPAGQNGPTAKDGTVKHGAVRDNAAKNDATGSGRPGSGGSSAEQKRAASERSADDDAWAEIVAAYGEEPPDPPGVAPWSAADGRAESMMDGSGREIAPGKPDKTLGTADDATPTRRAGADGSEGRGPDTDPDDSQARPAVPVGSSVVFAPGVGPRDWRPAEPSDNDLDATDEGHFVPPEPPPLPRADTTARFAWLAVLGGPLLLLLMVVFQQEITWWIATLGVGGFLGGFATLVMRMRSDDEEDEDPGRGAVV